MSSLWRAVDGEEVRKSSFSILTFRVPLRILRAVILLGLSSTVPCASSTLTTSYVETL
jgi:hypothetical protein